MKNKLPVLIVLVTAVCAATVCIATVSHRRAVKRAEVSVMQAQTQEDGTPEIVIMSDEQRKEFIKMLAKNPDFIASFNGASSAQDGEGVSHNLKYANSTQPLPLSYDIALYTIYKAQQYSIDPDLLFCLMWRESNFNPNSISKNTNGTYDYGLMQINSSNFGFLSGRVGITSMNDLLDPYKNIDCGVYFIGSYLKKYNNDYNKALMCYNLGEGGAQRKWNQGIYSTAYSRSIVEKMGCYYVVENYTMPKAYSPGAQPIYSDDSENDGYDEEMSGELEETETVTVEKTTAAKTKREYETHSREYEKGKNN